MYITMDGYIEEWLTLLIPCMKPIDQPLELLHDRRRQAHDRLGNRILHTPPVSQLEENQPYIHFHILSDPYETMSHWYSGGMDQFSETMRSGFLPFDNIFRSE